VNQVIRGSGDKIIAVDGVSTVNKSFSQVIALLRESGKNSYAIMRFLESRYASVPNDISSAGNRGRYAIEELKKKFSMDRKRLLVQRGMHVFEDDVEEEKEEEDEDASVAPPNSDDDDDDSAGSFQPDSDDEALDNIETINMENASSEKAASEKDGVEPPKAENKEKPDEDVKSSPPKLTKISSPEMNLDGQKSNVLDGQQESLTFRPEATHSLAFRLLNLDVGYSSDEGGDEDCAYFIDGVDETFTSQVEVPEELAKPQKKLVSGEDATVPVRRNEFSSLGDRSKLVASVAITATPPDLEDFDDNFPFPSKKAIAAKEAAAKEAESEAVITSSPEKQVKRSTVKVEQISVETSKIMNVWANVESAAATLQLPLNDLKRVLRGEYDEDFSDEVGGFRWQYAATGAVVTAGESKRSKKGKEAWMEFRDRLYDPNEPHIYKNNNRLRDYQVEGVNWLASTFYRKQGCIVSLSN
jgi:hypothetical protein